MSDTLTSNEIKNFETKEEFMKFYNEHKEEIDKLTTKDINKKYIIKDCKVSKNKNKLIIRSNSPKQTKPKIDNKETTKSNDIKPEQLEKMVNHIITQYEKQLNDLKDLKDKLISDNLYESSTSSTSSQNID